jgi:hypothetical protein
LGKHQPKASCAFVHLFRIASASIRSTNFRMRSKFSPGTTASSGANRLARHECGDVAGNCDAFD